MTFIGLHFSDNRNIAKILDPGTSLSPYPYKTVGFGIKTRHQFNNRFSVNSGFKFNKFDFPTGIIDDFLEVYNLQVPVEFNYRFLINKKNKIYLVPTLGTYLGINPFSNPKVTGAGVSRTSPLPFHDDEISYEYAAKIKQNWFGGNAGLSVEFTLFNESFLKIGYFLTSSFSNIYESETTYTRNNVDFSTGLITSSGFYKSFSFAFYYPLP